ncbi:TadE/TadG family type IV pilus assembly protein [Pendulispora albinea]|uniref:Pilus assembly protein n=1 Tax=Pendulispora albinea TaxID=2741071 RepID=A0ABZ2LMK1_9BACT
MKRASWQKLWLRPSSGTASIEFALILLPFSLLLLGMIDYGWYFFVDLACTNAVREGARTATTVPGACPNTAATNAGVAATSQALSNLLPADYAPSVTATCTTSSGSPRFSVSLTLDFVRLTGFTLVPMPSGGGGQVRVQTSATMRGTP